MSRLTIIRKRTFDVPPKDYELILVELLKNDDGSIKDEQMTLLTALSEDNARKMIVAGLADDVHNWFKLKPTRPL